MGSTTYIVGGVSLVERDGDTMTHLKRDGTRAPWTDQLDLEENGARVTDAQARDFMRAEGFKESRDCGSGSGGFQPGNSCATGGGGKGAGEWMNKSGYPKDVIKTVGDAKLYACKVAQLKAEGKTSAQAKKEALHYMTATPHGDMVADAKGFGIGMSSMENLAQASTMKNDPGIYAKEKAIASGAIKAGTDPAKPVAPIKAEPTSAPKQGGHAAPVPTPTPAKPDWTVPAKQPPKDKAVPSATPGQAPFGTLPEGNPEDWSSDTAHPSLTEVQKAVLASSPTLTQAIESYTGSGYNSLNKTLREGGSPTIGNLEGKMGAMVTGMDVLTRVDVKADPPPHTVYRGVKSPTLLKTIDSLGTGDTFVDKGFVSTSTSLSTATSFGPGGVVMKITTKWGASFATVSEHHTEKEFVLPRGSRFRVKTKEWRYQKGSGSGGTMLYVELEQVGVAS